MKELKIALKQLEVIDKNRRHIIHYRMRKKK